MGLMCLPDLSLYIQPRAIKNLRVVSTVVWTRAELLIHTISETGLSLEC